jgi:hypothetical protein
MALELIDAASRVDCTIDPSFYTCDLDSSGSQSATRSPRWPSWGPLSLLSGTQPPIPVRDGHCPTCVQADHVRGEQQSSWPPGLFRDGPPPQNTRSPIATLSLPTIHPDSLHQRSLGRSTRKAEGRGLTLMESAEGQGHNRKTRERECHQR